MAFTSSQRSVIYLSVVCVCSLVVVCPQQEREEVVEDFVRNFLVTAGLHKTADIFQAEWSVPHHILCSWYVCVCVCRYELQLSGRLQSHYSQSLPDIYAQ